MYLQKPWVYHIEESAGEKNHSVIRSLYSRFEILRCITTLKWTLTCAHNSIFSSLFIRFWWINQNSTNMKAIIIQYKNSAILWNDFKSLLVNFPQFAEIYSTYEFRSHYNTNTLLTRRVMLKFLFMLRYICSDVLSKRIRSVPFLDESQYTGILEIDVGREFWQRCLCHQNVFDQFSRPQLAELRSA